MESQKIVDPVMFLYRIRVLVLTELDCYMWFGVKLDISSLGVYSARSIPTKS